MWIMPKKILYPNKKNVYINESFQMSKSIWKYLSLFFLLDIICSIRFLIEGFFSLMILLFLFGCCCLFCRWRSNFNEVWEYCVWIWEVALNVDIGVWKNNRFDVFSNCFFLNWLWWNCLFCLFSYNCFSKYWGSGSAHQRS